MSTQAYKSGRVSCTRPTSNSALRRHSPLWILTYSPPESPLSLRYLGNYYYNITNKLALKAAGGSAGFSLTIATLQLGVGCLYAMFLWAAPDARATPKVTKDDIIAMIPVAFCAAAAHSFSVFALSAGAVSFGQIVKAAEPAFAAVLGVSLYGKKISKGKVHNTPWPCIISRDDDIPPPLRPSQPPLAACC